jgi:hypothetical protein
MEYGQMCRLLSIFSRIRHHFGVLRDCGVQNTGGEVLFIVRYYRLTPQTDDGS